MYQNMKCQSSLVIHDMVTIGKVGTRSVEGKASEPRTLSISSKPSGGRFVLEVLILGMMQARRMLCFVFQVLRRRLVLSDTMGSENEGRVVCSGLGGRQ